MQDGIPSSPFQSLFAPAALHIDPNRTALLVVDMQYFDAHPDWGEGRTAQEMGVIRSFDPFFAEVDAAIPRIQELLAFFRQKQMEVIHLRVAEWTKDSRDVGYKQLVRGLIVPSNSKEAEFLEEVAPVGDELIVSKSASGVFSSTSFDRLLRNMGIDTLLFTGTSTGGCVESAVRDALDLGYQVAVVDDACADSSKASHKVALGRMSALRTHIVQTDEIVEELASLPPGDPELRSGIARVQPYLPVPTGEPPPADVNPYSLIFGEPIQTPFTRTGAALVIVDAQRFTCDPAVGLGAAAANAHTVDSLARTQYYARVERALHETQQILAVFRAAGMQVIHVRTAAQRTDGRDLARPLRAAGFDLYAGGVNAEWMPGFAPEAGEITINKPGSGCFTGTALDDLLRNLGVETVVLAGVSWDGAIESTIRSAGDRGYCVLVASDACATFDEGLQSRLEELQSGVNRVIASEALRARVESLV